MAAADVEREVHQGPFAPFLEANTVVKMLREQIGRDNVEAAFAEADVDKTGYIAEPELRMMLRKVLPEAEKEKLTTPFDKLSHTVFSWLDHDHTGRLSKDEFHEFLFDTKSLHSEPYMHFKEFVFLASLMRDKVGRAGGEASFRFFDKEGTGRLHVREIKKMVKRCIPKEDRASFHDLSFVVMRLVQYIDLDESGSLSWAEFADYLYDDDASVLKLLTDIKAHLSQLPDRFLEAALREADDEKDGQLDAREIAAVLVRVLDEHFKEAQWGEHTSKVHMMAIASALDEPGKTMTVNEFLQFAAWLTTTDLDTLAAAKE